MIDDFERRRETRHGGSIAAVILIAVVLVALGGVSLLMSTSFGRSGYHERLVADSHEMARAAVDEASMLINNGKRNMQIDEAVGTARPVEVPLAEMKGGNSPLAGIPKDRLPRVVVKASVINYTTGLHRDTAMSQLDRIEKFDLPVADEATRKFWSRVDREGLHDKETGQETAADSPGGFIDGYVKQVGVSGWKPAFDRVKDPEFTDTNGVRHFKWVQSPRMPELRAVFELFRTATGPYVDVQEVVLPEGQSPQPDVKTNAAKPSQGDFAKRWEAAIRAVARDAAKKVEACGANPSLAMAHLVGDLKIGKEIASGAEVAATAAFMRDPTIGVNKTYLLEISAAMGYEGAAGRMKGKQAFRTYRLLQKAEWEIAMRLMAERLASDLQDQGAASLAPGDLAALFPADSADKERDLPVPGKGTARYDPKKMLDDLVYAELPSTVGARLYPYGVASVRWDPDRLEATDARK